MTDEHEHAMKVWREACGAYEDNSHDLTLSIRERTIAGDQAAAAVIAADRAGLVAEIERLRANAARYEWLRDCSCPPHNFYISVPDEFAGTRYTPDEVDTYIDAARAALKDTRND